MKKIIMAAWCWVLMLFCSVVNGQNISQFQYYFDTEPGLGIIGNGGFITVPVPSDSVRINAGIPTSVLSEGFHTLSVRAQYDNGLWGLWRSYPFTITPPPTITNHTVTHAEYFFDTETGVASAIQLPIGVTPADSVNFISSIPTTGLSEGFHTLYLRVKDSQNHWGLWRSYPFAVTPPPPPVSQIVDGEAFFDTDPGVGNGIPLWLPTAPLDSVNIARNVFAPNSLGNGTHYAYFRFKDANGKWSLHDRDTFTVSGSACILPAAITANGPIAICTGDQVILTENSMGAFTWQWKESGNPVGANSRHLAVNSSGTYTCEVTSGTCTATSNTIVVSVYPPSTWYEDSDHDTYGNLAVTLIACTQPLGYVSNSNDCNDNNINIHSPVQYYVDADHDGYGSTTTAMVCALTPPLGYSTNDDDCDDTKNFVYPGAIELCNGIDDNCNNQIDENQFTISSVLTSIKCKGTNSGAIDVSINGGLPPFTYLWNNGSTNEDRENLFAGTYTVTVTSGGCTSSASFIITQPATVMSISLSRTTIRCGGKSTGILTALPSGGGVSYTYLWTGGFTTSTINGLPIGAYTVTITDNLGCTKTKSVQMTENPPQAVYISPAGPANQYMANRSGGVGPWTYHWNTNPLQTSQIATILSNGNYRVKVTDSKGCTVISSSYGVAKIDGTTVSENSVNDISVHPNPSNGFISISGLDCSNCNIQLSLTDVIGKLIYQSTEIVNANHLEKDFSFLQKGIYMLMIRNRDKTKVVKLVMK